MKTFFQSELWRFGRRRPLMLLGFGVVVLTLFLAVFGETLAPYPTQAPAVVARFQYKPPRITMPAPPIQMEPVSIWYIRI